MGLEAANYISELDPANPTGSDIKGLGDNHLRMIKLALKQQFPNFTPVPMNATVVELNYLVGVTSSVQTQLNGKGNLIGGNTWSGQQDFGAGPVLVPMPTLAGQAATKGYVDGVAMSAAIPAGPGDTNKLLTNNGVFPGWGPVFTPLTAPDVGKLLGVTAPGTIGTVAARGVGGATATGNVTLTAASPAVQLITPAGPGQWVQVPDATTVPVGEGLYALCNLGGHDVEIRNALAVPIGYVQAGSTVAVSLQSAASAAGAWCLDGAAAFGVLASEINFGLSLGTSPALIAAASIDDHRELLVFSGTSNLQGVVWDGNTAQFGTPVTLRATWGAAPGAFARAIKSATDQALLVSCPAGTNFEAVALTITGTSIVPGTAATATLGGSLTFFDDLVAVAGQGWVTSYRRNGGCGLRALTITGTAAAVGAESLTGGDATLGYPTVLFDMTGGKVVSVDYSTLINIQLRTVTGTTLTAGTGATLVGTPMVVRQLASGRLAIAHTPASNLATGSIVSVAGTVASTSSAATGPSSANFTFGHVVGNQMLFGYLAGNSAYIDAVTDNAGTAVAGTQITRLSGTAITPYLIGADATSVTVLVQPGAATSATGYILRIGLNGNNPRVLAGRYVNADLFADGGVTKPNITTLNTVFKDPLPPPVLRGTYGSVAGLVLPKNLLWVSRGGLPKFEPVQPTIVLTGGQGARRSVAGNWEWAGVEVQAGVAFAVQRIKVA